jgi:predicted DNA-binding transcriptional regulator YafY
MTNPTTRVLALLELLQSHGLMSGTELARRLQVDPRTLRRYIQALDALGIPVLAERGRDGGYRLMHGFKLPPMMFTNDEAMALSLGLLASRSLGLDGKAPAGESALSKLERVMPDKLSKRVRAVGETVALDIRRASASSDGAILATLSAAAQDQQRVRIAYLSPQLAQSERDIDPYGLAFVNGSLYAVAYCHLRRGQRAFRVDRVQAATALPQSFGRPAQFDAVAYMNTAFATLPRAHSVRVLLHADLAVAQAAIFTTLGVLEKVDGGTMLHSQADDLGWMARELARLPFSFSIVHPAALRDELVRHATALLAHSQ